MRVSLPTVVGGLGVAVTSVALWAGSGPVGLLAAGLLVAIWFVAPASYAATFGQVGLATLVVPTGATLTLAAGAAGTVAILLGPLFGVAVPYGRVALGIGCVIVATGGVWVVSRWTGTLWMPSVLLVCAVTLAFALLFRYEMVVRTVTEGGSDA